MIHSLYKFLTRDQLSIFCKSAVCYTLTGCVSGQKMNFRNVSRHGNIAQNWRCPKRGCRKNKGLRIDTWFHPSKLEFNTILKFIFWWAREQTSIKFCRRVGNVGKRCDRLFDVYAQSVCEHNIATLTTGNYILYALRAEIQTLEKKSHTVPLRSRTRLPNVVQYHPISMLLVSFDSARGGILTFHYITIK